jgi:hypothetical protein
MIRVTCAQCQWTFLVGNDAAGTALPCTKCGERIEVPPQPASELVVAEGEFAGRTLGRQPVPELRYKIIEARGEALNLQEQVNRHIGGGWVPLGGVAVAYSPQSGSWWFYQAMIKEPAAATERPNE